MIKELDAKALEKLMQERDEKEYILVDVRQHEEYRLDHIPGAKHIPLGEIQFDPFVFEDDRDIIFYCKGGGRSKAAAMFVAEEAGLKKERLYNLRGGMMAYTGEILLDYPRVDRFPSDLEPAEIMHKSIDLEKGAYIFYTLAADIFKETDLFKLMDDMSKAETAHARSIYKQLTKIEPVEQDFETLFQACEGRILEGGKSLSSIKEFISSAQKADCMDVLEFAIEIEYTAYDLYRTMAETTGQEPVKEMFFKLAQAEKGHLRRIISNLELC